MQISLCISNCGVIRIRVDFDRVYHICYPEGTWVTYSDKPKPSRVSIYKGQQVAWVKTVHKWEDQNNIMSSTVTEVITKERSGIGE